MGLTILPPSPDPPLSTTHKHSYDSSDNEIDIDSPSDNSPSNYSHDNSNRPSKRLRLETDSTSQIAIPGELITDETQWMRGHGTFIPDTETGRIHASLAGNLVKTNKLLTVVAVRGRKFILFLRFALVVGSCTVSVC
jgi:exosome complex component RRP4